MGRERLYFVPLGDTAHDHPRGVCSQALKLRNRLLKGLDAEEGVFHMGTCTPCFPGMPFEREGDKLEVGYHTGGCWVKIEPLKTKIKP